MRYRMRALDDKRATLGAMRIPKEIRALKLKTINKEMRGGDNPPPYPSDKIIYEYI